MQHYVLETYRTRINKELFIKHALQQVLRIRDNLVRIRIRGSVPLITYDPGIFVSDIQEGDKNYIFCKFFYLLLFEGALTSFFKKSHKEVTKK
jgi:hypothetical protein